MFAEVIFPQKLKTFTYKLPHDALHDLRGRIVRAPLINLMLYGIIRDVRETESHIECNPQKIKEIISIHGHLGSPSLITLLNWLSGYYLNPVGIALSNFYFKEAAAVMQGTSDCNSQAFSKTNILKPQNASEVSDGLFDFSLGNAPLIVDTLRKNKFAAFLYHSPSFFHEREFLYEILKNEFKRISGAIILTPEIDRIDEVASLLKIIFGERVCILHSKQTKKNRLETIKGILSGRHDIVVGTRSAIFAPLTKLSFIVVTSEHSPLYKAEERLRYNARDVAIMRGLFEKVPVLLSSICPSVESVYNCRKGRYTLLKVPSYKSALNIGFSLYPAKKRAIRILNMSATEKNGHSIPEEILFNAKRILHKKEHLLFIVSTKGYSLILCGDCGYIFRCPICRTALRFYKNDGLLKCRMCGYSGRAPDTCYACGGIQLKTFGRGEERIKEDIEKSFGKWALPLFKNGLFYNSENQLKPLVLGHRSQAKKLKENSFMLAVYFDADLSLSEPIFCANERVFQSLTEISQLVKPGGRIYIPTRYPKNKILSFIEHYDFRRFYKHEILLRKETNFPPFTRLILFNLLSNKRFDNFRYEIERIFTGELKEGIQIYGPVEISSPLKSYKYCIQYLLKSTNRKMLNSFASSLRDRLCTIKGIKVITDVDPIKV